MNFQHTGNSHVVDRASFINFINDLREAYTTNPENWENTNISDFLEAIARYTEDIQGYYDNTNQKIDANEPSWQLFADVLKGASVYE